MESTEAFIQKYFARYLAYCHKQGSSIPKSNELKKIISYLSNKHLDPVIIGSLAIFKYIKLSDEDFNKRKLRLLHTINLVISKDPCTPPPRWKSLIGKTGRTFWISSAGNIFELIKIRDLFQQPPKQFHISCDPESIQMGCPVADIFTLFLINLDSGRDRDFFDLLSLAKNVGISKDIDKHLWTPRQIEKLKFVLRRVAS